MQVRVRRGGGHMQHWCSGAGEGVGVEGDTYSSGAVVEAVFYTPVLYTKPTVKKDTKTYDAPNCQPNCPACAQAYSLPP